MAVSISKLRSDIYRLIDEVLATGEPLEIERRGQILRITREQPASKIDRIVPIPGLIVGDPQDLVSIDWSEHWKPYLGDDEPAPAHRADPE
ncbi:MAG: type II toxin-antitoxin system Phd/YefM family antitoxin [Myxococcota bacterium]